MNHIVLDQSSKVRCVPKSVRDLLLTGLHLSIRSGSYYCAMELVLICHACGHEEVGTDERALMLKIKMYNHVNREHPHLVEQFKEFVNDETVRSEALEHSSS